MSSFISNRAAYNYLVPADGTTHVVFQQCDFVVSGYVEEDWVSFSANHFKFRPQGVYIDNTGGTSTATFTVEGTPFTASIPAGYAGWVSFPSTANLTTKISGTGTVNLAYVDYPVFNNTPVDSDGNPPGGSMDVNNPVTSPANVQTIVDGAVVDAANPLPVVMESINIQSATLVSGSTSADGSSTIGTPPADSNLRKLTLSLAEDAAQATAGELVITVSLNGKTIFTEGVYVPASALSNRGALYQRDLDFSLVAFGAGSGTLDVSLSTALTSGKLYVNGYFD